MLHEILMDISWVIGGTAGGVAGAVDAVAAFARTQLGIALLPVMGGWL